MDSVAVTAVARLQKRIRDVVFVAAVVAFSTLLLSYLLTPPLGLLGPGVGWLISYTLVALAVSPRTWKMLTSGSPLGSEA